MTTLNKIRIECSACGADYEQGRQRIILEDARPVWLPLAIPTGCAHCGGKHITLSDPNIKAA